MEERGGSHAEVMFGVMVFRVFVFVLIEIPPIIVFEIGQKKCNSQKVLLAGLFDYCIFSVKKSKIMFFLFF